MDNEIIDNKLIPGTAQIRKIAASHTPIELLELSSRLAKEGLDKKLWSVLSRVYEDKKGFGEEYDPKMDAYVSDIIASNVSAELKLQMYTSFELPEKLLPDRETIDKLIEGCPSKRTNIAGHFIVRYRLENLYYNKILADKDMFKVVVKFNSGDRVVDLYEHIISTESKEVITGAIRTLENSKLKLRPISEEKMAEFAKLIFESKEVFFTTKLIYCMAFGIPRKVIPMGRDLDKILTISISYEERITKDFVARYRLHFDVSDKAICKYYIANKKTSNEKNLVAKFATHIVKVEDEGDKNYLLRSAFKRGGYFRMYAGCMQDGEVNVDKLHRFRYSDGDIEWCKNLPGLK